MDCIDDLEYRGEGNCAIVFANPKKRQVYRLVKRDYTKISRTKLKSSPDDDESFKSGQTVDTDVRSKLEDTVSYVTNIMDCLLSFNYAVIPELISIQRGFGEEAVKKTEQSRPAHRKKSWRNEVDPDIYTALVLSDCCFVRSSLKSNSGATTQLNTTQEFNSGINYNSERTTFSMGDFHSSSSSSDSSLECKNNLIHPNDLHNNHNGVSKKTHDDDHTHTSLCFDYDQFFINNICPYSSSALNLPLTCCCNLYSNKSLCDLHTYRRNNDNVDDDDVSKIRNNSDAVIILDHDIVNNDSVNSNSSCSFQSTDSSISSVENDHQCMLDLATTRVSFSSPSSLSCKRSNFTLSFEIKPKKAFRTVSQKNDIADQACRFCMHKYLKVS